MQYNFLFVFSETVQYYQSATLYRPVPYLFCTDIFLMLLSGFFSRYFLSLGGGRHYIFQRNVRIYIRTTQRLISVFFTFSFPRNAGISFLAFPRLFLLLNAAHPPLYWKIFLSAPRSRFLTFNIFLIFTLISSATKNCGFGKSPMSFAARYAKSLVFCHIKKSLSRQYEIRIF